MRMSEDLPVPFAPTRPIRSRGPMVKLARSRTTLGPKASESSLAARRLTGGGQELTFLQAANKGATPPGRMLPPSRPPLRADPRPGGTPEEESHEEDLRSRRGRRRDRPRVRRAHRVPRGVRRARARFPRPGADGGLRDRPG